MTELEIRPVSLDDDFEAQLDLGQQAFGPYSGQQKVSWLSVARLRASQGLFLGAFADGVPAGAAMLHDMRQYWLGRTVPCGGVASVKVAPEHRGRGIGRALMTSLLELTAERGYLLSALYPATVPIYRSLGWELAGAKYEFTVPARSLRELAGPDTQAAAADPPAPPVRRVTPGDAAAMIDVTARSHLAARDAGAISWDEGPARQWLEPAGPVRLPGGRRPARRPTRWRGRRRGRRFRRLPLGERRASCSSSGCTPPRPGRCARCGR